MTDEEALWAAICDHPDEDTPRLAYADFLDERGREPDVARAEISRLQVERAGLDPASPRAAELRAREIHLLWEWEKSWRAEHPADVCRWCLFRRGFLIRVAGTSEGVLAGLE